MKKVIFKIFILMFLVSIIFFTPFFINSANTSVIYNQNTSTFIIPTFSKYYKSMDQVLEPIMLILGGFKKDSVQQTHPWHVRNIDPNLISKENSLSFEGSDYYTIYKTQKGPGFHIPILGGWKKYVVLEVESSNTPWYIGWIVYDKNNNGEIIFSQININPINQNKVKVLSGSPNLYGYFFAIDKKGNQIKVEKIGDGVLGDNKYKDISLF